MLLYNMIRVSKSKPVDVVEKRRQEILAKNIGELLPQGWRPHPRFTTYVARADGTVMHAVSRVKSIGSMNQGYNIVQPVLQGKQYNIARHAFIYECFNGVYDRKTHQIDHINRICTDDRLDNLEKLTLKEHGEKTKLTVSKTRAISNQRPVICVETGQGFASVNLAGAHIDPHAPETAAKGIGKALSGYRKSYLSLTWRYDQDENLGGEIWKGIASDEIFDSIMVSNLGRIRLKTGKITEGSMHGECRVNVTNSKKKKAIFSIHYLVCRAFHGDPPGTWEDDRISVNHKNLFHDDNRAENLEWSNPQMQAAHRKEMKEKVLLSKE